MKLTQTALNKLNTTRTRLLVALALGVSERWIIACIKSNENDGLLTKATALKIIKEETGLTDAEILTEELERVG